MVIVQHTPQGTYRHEFKAVARHTIECRQLDQGAVSIAVDGHVFTGADVADVIRKILAAKVR